MNATLWELLWLAFHVVGLVGLFYLWDGAPDNVQRVVIGLLTASLSIYIVIDLVRMFSPPDVYIDRNLFRAASLPMQLAVLLAIGRVWQLQRDAKCRKSPPALD